jgi:hypothetical protein
MEIATGTAEQHPTPLPYDAALSPALAQPTPIASGAPVQGAVRDTTGEFQSQMTEGAADCRAAQAAAQDARNAMLGHYQAQALPLGGHIGDAMALPSGYPDAGTVAGLTDPEGIYYTPPRLGAGQDYAGPGNQP